MTKAAVTAILFLILTILLLGAAAAGVEKYNKKYLFFEVVIRAHDCVGVNLHDIKVMISCRFNCFCSCELSTAELTTSDF